MHTGRIRCYERLESTSRYHHMASYIEAIDQATYIKQMESYMHVTPDRPEPDMAQMKSSQRQTHESQHDRILLIIKEGPDVA